MAMIPVVHGKGLTTPQLREQIRRAEAKPDKTPTEEAWLRLMKTCLEIREQNGV